MSGPSRTSQRHNLEGNFEAVTSGALAELFVERNGRVYSSSGTSPYPLPIDVEEQKRMNGEHNALHALFRENFLGAEPANILNNSSDHTKLVVDIGCGTGVWVLEMANKYPDAMYVGLDIVPIAQRNAPNVSFEFHDINTRTRFEDGSVDFVHARFCAMTVRNYNVIIHEAARILRPGGIFVWGEWRRAPRFHPSIELNAFVEVPAFCRFYQLFNERLKRHELYHVADVIPTFLQATEVFNPIRPLLEYVPIGSWPAENNKKQVGRVHRRALHRFMDSVKPFLLDSDLEITEEDLDALCAAAQHEIDDVHGRALVSEYLSGFAIRV